MLLLNHPVEKLAIERITHTFRRSPLQINCRDEADAELITFSGSDGNVLAVTTDSLVEEISSGLYDNPWLMGWMLAMVNFSDLAAVGAKPLGLVLAVALTAEHGGEFVNDLGSGISAACERIGSFVLGGDTNFGDRLQLSATAIGEIRGGKPLTRLGCAPGDHVYLSGVAGSGNVFAFQTLTHAAPSLNHFVFMPTAKIAEGQMLRGVATCCMDTSDGVLLTVGTLARLNHCHISLNDDCAAYLHPAARELCRHVKVPAWVALAGIHGEFELCFTLRPEWESDFLRRAAASGWSPVLVGKVTEGSGVNLETSRGAAVIDTEHLRELAADAGGNHRGYIGRLIEYAREIGE